MPFENEFFRQLDGLHQAVLRFEDDETRALAESLIPFDELNNRVQAEDPPKKLVKDFFILELVKWFKNEFFEWKDVPKCPMCVVSKSTFQGLVEPNREEKQGLASRVEFYSCPTCCEAFRYPRYNCPRKLLQTRQGRCGEFANCFTLMCLAAGYDARYVYDVTDHVWTEVWSEGQNRWIHCDPCEAEVDKPLMYELGWKKDLSYVFAFTLHETLDVTWRYVTNFAETMARRRKVPENELIRYQEDRNNKYQSSLDEATKFSITQRRVLDLASFMIPPKPRSTDSFSGRTSGDLDWRLARNESQSGAVIRNTDPDVSSMELNYCSSQDKYTLTENNVTVKNEQGWAKMVKTAVNIHRKVECDWKMAYLARLPNTDSGMFEYNFELSKPCVTMDLLFKRETFDAGRCTVTITVDGSKKIVISETTPEKTLTRTIDGGKEIKICCELSGTGNADTAWQKSQAFRQSLTDESSAFRVKFNF